MRSSDVVFLTVAEVLEIHSLALEAGGGTEGLRDAGQAAAATMAPRNAYYSTLADLASVYAFGIAESQAFLDGNKRTALAVAGTFLDVNGFPVVLDPDRFEALMLGLATGGATRGDLAAAFTEAMGGDPGALEDE